MPLIVELLDQVYIQAMKNPQWVYDTINRVFGLDEFEMLDGVALDYRTLCEIACLWGQYRKVGLIYQQFSYIDKMTLQYWLKRIKEKEDRERTTEEPTS